MPLPGNLKCNNKKCGHVFPVSDFRSNTPIQCPRCGERSQYRFADFIRENRADHLTLAVLCQRVADDNSVDDQIRARAIKMRIEWVALQSPPSSSPKEEDKLNAKRKALAELMAELLAKI